MLRQLYLVLFLLIVFSNQAICAEDPEDLYCQEEYSEAEEGYSNLSKANPENMVYLYNKACATYQLYMYPIAGADFLNVLNKTEDNNLRFRAAYNLGNIMFFFNDFSNAAESFKKALQYNPNHADAGYNFELALRMLEKAGKAENGAAPERKQNSDKKEDPPKQEKENPENKPETDSREPPSSPRDQKQTGSQQKLSQGRGQDKNKENF